MTDTRTQDQRRRIMAAVKSKNTSPELGLRSALHAAGIRGWRIHYRRAPGTPDLAWPSLRVALFVDGAFWHGHPSRHRPGRSGEYWDNKIARNVERDRAVDKSLEGSGWKVIRVWDFEIHRELPKVVEQTRSILLSRLPQSPKATWQRRLQIESEG